jgi:hypothetical protein
VSTESPATATNAAEVAAFPPVVEPGAEIQDEAAPRPSWIRRLIPRPATDRPRGAGTSSDPLLAFASEGDGGLAAAAVHPRQLQPDDETVSAAPARTRVTWIRVALAALTLVALAQGALIALWVRSGRIAAPIATGMVTITSQPAGSPVTIDGTPRGVTPVSLALDPGAHRVDVGTGGGVRTQVIDVVRGAESSLHIDLPAAAATETPASAPTGGLQISTDPAGARVSVDGQAYGAAPILVRDLQPGAHNVTVTGPNGSMTRRVTVQEGAVSSLIISLAGTGEFASGWLTVDSPIPAQITQGGTLLGTTDIPRIMVPAGRHDLVITNAALGFRAQRTVQITAGRTTAIALDVPKGTLHVNALPWAEVWIDGQRAGETPLGNVSLPIGTHQIVFRHPELGEQRKSVVVTAGTPTRVGVDLRTGS